MKKWKDYKTLTAALLLTLAATIALSVYAARKAAAPVEKEVHSLGSIDFLYRDFETAAERAASIIYGKVEKKGEMRGTRASEYETDVTVKVLEWIKGDMQSGQVTFLEMGGETDTAIYRWDNITPVEVGESYIFFLNEYGAFLDPSKVLHVSGKTVQANGFTLPASLQNSETNEIPLDTYLEAVREACP